MYIQVDTHYIVWYMQKLVDIFKKSQQYDWVFLQKRQMQMIQGTIEVNLSLTPSASSLFLYCVSFCSHSCSWAQQAMDLQASLGGYKRIMRCSKLQPQNAFISNQCVNIKKIFSYHLIYRHLFGDSLCAAYCFTVSGRGKSF